MKLACEYVAYSGSDWREALAAGLDIGLPGFVSLEWLIDKAERGEWSGSWW